MKKINLIILSCSMFWIGCDLPVEIETQDQTNFTSFVLCEGNYGAGNAALWSFDPAEENSEQLILGGTALGDVGQSMTLDDYRLFTVINNSHKIEIFDVEESITHLGTIQLNNASPRYIVADENLGYVSCWNLAAILLIDLNNHAVIDTIATPGMPEDLILDGSSLFASIPMNNYWGTENSVIEISTQTRSIINTYETISGPTDMELIGSYLFVAGTYYGQDWTTYTGLTKIDIINGIVTTYADGANFHIKGDLVTLDESLYRLTTTGLAPVNNDLSLDMDQVLGNQTSAYSAWANSEYIYFGTTDFSAPDTVSITNHAGELVNQVVVGAIPGDFISISK